MIRFRYHDGSEAEWDRGEWSGDENAISQLRVLQSIEEAWPGPCAAYAHVQARMAERFPAHGIVVVRQTKPPAPPRIGDDGLEIIS